MAQHHSSANHASKPHQPIQPPIAKTSYIKHTSQHHMTRYGFETTTWVSRAPAEPSTPPFREGRDRTAEGNDLIDLRLDVNLIFEAPRFGVAPRR
jgi:hypothetical protein